MIPFRRQNNQSAGSSHLDIDHDSSQELAMTPQRTTQSIQMSPMGNPTRHHSLLGNNYRRRNSSEFLSKNENKNESTKKLAFSNVWIPNYKSRYSDQLSFKLLVQKCFLNKVFLKNNRLHRDFNTHCIFPDIKSDKL